MFLFKFGYLFIPVILFIFPPVCLFNFLPIYLSVCQSVLFLPLLSIYLSIYNLHFIVQPVQPYSLCVFEIWTQCTDIILSVLLEISSPQSSWEASWRGNKSDFLSHFEKNLHLRLNALFLCQIVADLSSTNYLPFIISHSSCVRPKTAREIRTETRHIHLPNRWYDIAKHESSV